MVRLTKIYTRTGDVGETGLVDGSRVPQSDARLDAMGDVDEANSLIGVAATHADGDTLTLLRRVQNDLFDLGADIATPSGIEGALRIVQPQIDRLEGEIEILDRLADRAQRRVRGAARDAAHREARRPPR